MSEMDDQGVRNAVAFVPATSIQMRFSDAEAAKFDRWLTRNNAEVAATERARIVKHLSSSSIVTVAGKGGALEWLRKTEPEGN